MARDFVLIGSSVTSGPKRLKRATHCAAPNTFKAISEIPFKVFATIYFKNAKSFSVAPLVKSPLCALF